MCLSNQGPTELLWLWSSCLWPKDERDVDHWRPHRLSKMGSIVVDGRDSHTFKLDRRGAIITFAHESVKDGGTFSTSHRYTQAMIVSCFGMVHLYFIVFQNPPLSAVPFGRSGTMAIKKWWLDLVIRRTLAHSLRRASWITANSCCLLVTITHMPKRIKKWCTAGWFYFLDINGLGNHRQMPCLCCQSLPFGHGQCTRILG